MDNVEWEIHQPGSVSSTAKKIAHVPMQRSSDSMSASEKEGVRVWNLMRKTLLDNGLMEDKS